MKIQIVSFITLLILGCSAIAGELKRVEPPFWWVGMQNQHLQLMLHGNDLAGSVVESDSAYVQVKSSHSLSNPNYLFVDLVISDQAKPHTVSFTLSKEGEQSIFSYELKQRRDGSAMREGFSSRDVIYLVTPDRFANGDPANDNQQSLSETVDRQNRDGRHGGDLQGLTQNLDYLERLGITQVWLNPLQENNEPNYSYHGYSISDLYQIDPRFGGNQALLEFVASAADRGIGLIMDSIPNHIGVNHWWMKDLPDQQWINSGGKFAPTSHRRETIQDPYAAAIDKLEFNDHWFVPTMPDLNQNVAELVTYLIQNNIWWIEYASLSGLRIDTLPYADKHFTAKFNTAILNEYPKLNIVGEEWSANPAIVSYWQKDKINSDGFNGQIPSLMDFPLQEALIHALMNDAGFNTGLIRLYLAIADDFQYPNAHNLVTLGDNHDMSRLFTQLDESPDLLKMALGILMTTRGIPQLFYGTEIGMSNKGSDAHGDIREDFPGGWPGDPKNAFTGKAMNELEKSLLDYTQKLLNWRKSSAPIHNGELMHYVPKDDVYVYFRYTDDEAVMVVVNKNNELVNLPTKRFAQRLDGFTEAQNALTKDVYNLDANIEVPALSTSIFELK